MFCTTCGAQIEEDAAFCTSCGAPVRGAEPDADVAATVPLAGAQAPAQAAQPGYDAVQQLAGQTPQHQQAYQQSPTKTSNRGVLIVVLVIALAAAIAAALYFSGVLDGDKDDVRPASTAQVSGNAQQPQSADQNAGATAQQADSPDAASASQPAQSQQPSQDQGQSSATSQGSSIEGQYFSTDTTYVNERFGYSILIPAGFTCIEETDTGAHFTNPSGIEIKTFGINNTGGTYTLEGRYQTAVDVNNPVYSTVLEDKDAYVVSWYNGNAEFYQMEYVGPGSLTSFVVVYPSDVSEGDAVVEQIQPTFTAGDIWNEH